MINKLVEFALKQPLFILLGTILFIGAGTIAFKALPVEAFPDVTDTQVTVITLFPGRAAEEVEKQVTLPLEVKAPTGEGVELAICRTYSDPCQLIPRRVNWLA